jgi:hypothetical protein
MALGLSPKIEGKKKSTKERITLVSVLGMDSRIYRGELLGSFYSNSDKMMMVAQYIFMI